MEQKNKLKGSDVFIEPDLSKEKLAKNYELRIKKREESKNAKLIEQKKRRRSNEGNHDKENRKILKENGDDSLEITSEEMQEIYQVSISTPSQ